MTRLTPLLTSLKTLNITYQTPQETLLGTPETLPTSEPATPQIGYTVQSSDLPSLSFNVYSKKWVALVIGAGKFVTAGNIYWRMKKNGSSVYYNYASIPANSYYTVRAYFLDVAVNDILELALWSNVSDSNWDYKAYQIHITQIVPFRKPTILKPCNFASLTSVPNLTLGNPYGSGTQGLYPVSDDLVLQNIIAAKNFNVLYAALTYGICRIHYGDYSYANQATNLSSSSYRPYYYKHYVPTQIIIRGLKID
ncbi:MAG: hypothetical protein QXR76_06695 [Candidatus Bathyarchaeia archaeon]